LKPFGQQIVRSAIRLFKKLLRIYEFLPIFVKVLPRLLGS
jgi:hypothetical protein